MKVALRDQVEEMRKLISERERYFPRLVELGKVTPEEADLRLNRTRAARLTLELVAEYEDEIRKLLVELKSR